MNQPEKTNIRHIADAQLQEWLASQGEPKFRYKQIREWLWQKAAHSFDEMTNLSKALREKLTEAFVINPVQIESESVSADGTIKFGFRLHDGHLTEGVLIPSRQRMTACISSQIGCSLTCRFCATGQISLKRNLRFDEIFDQVALINQRTRAHYGLPLSNIVYMGMGEPLLNYKQVLQSIDRITGADGLGMSPKRITVSTVGVAKMIRQLADDNRGVNFALSLHVANEDKRRQIMPITESNGIGDLQDAVRYFYQQTGIRITYEYTLLRGFNDTLDDAKHLAEFCKATPCKINLIEYNPVEGSLFDRSDNVSTDQFKEFLESCNLVVNVRRSRGKDIDAACGQLANKQEKQHAS